MENTNLTRKSNHVYIKIEHVKESLWFNEGDDDHEIKQKYHLKFS